MTTSITVEAHHALTKFVQVDTSVDGKRIESTTLQDGQRATFYAYEGRQITVRERLNDEPPGPYAAFPAFQQRVLEEKDELAKKFSALEAFLLTDIFAGLPAAERERLHDQRKAMGEYLYILTERIAAFTKI